jgi:hypothetical protein
MIDPKQLAKEDTARRAYELYVQRGSQPGKAVEDWLRAEKELTGEVVVAPAKTVTATAGRNQN